MLITVNTINVIKENNSFQPLGTVSFFFPFRTERNCFVCRHLASETEQKIKSILFILSIVVLLKLVNCRCITLDFSQLLPLLVIYSIHDNKADLL